MIDWWPEVKHDDPEEFKTDNGLEPTPHLYVQTEDGFIDLYGKPEPINEDIED